MKQFFTFFLALTLTSGLFAQSAYFIKTKGTSAPYVYNQTGATDIMTTGNEVLSAWQSLPFAWNFYGSSVSGYYASDNGYITFDNSASTSVAANTTLPNAAGPNNAIYGFWDDFNVNSASGNPDKIRTWTYGTSPNRTHCIQWWSMTPQSNTSSWVYITIRLHEGGDFSIVHDYSATTAPAATTGTIGCENATGSKGTQVPGAPFTNFTELGIGAGDDVVYTFKYTNNTYDVTVTSTSMKYTVDAGAVSVTGDMANLGPVTLTSFNVNYSVNGGSTVTQSITGASIAPGGGGFTFVHSSPYTAVAGQKATVKMWIDNINGGNQDENHANDTLDHQMVAANGFTTHKRVLLEEFTGAWCGWCPDGAVVMENIYNTNGGDAIPVSVHDGDAMEFAEGIRSEYAVTSYPGAQIDRYHFSGEAKIPHSRSKWAANTATRMNAIAPVGVGISSTYNSVTRTVNASVTAEFVDYHMGDARIVLMVVEDSVTGSGTGYNQTNYLNTQAGHTYYGAGDPIVGFIHRHVLRALPTTAFGASGTIPFEVSPNVAYTEDFTFTLDPSWNASHIHLVAFVADYYDELDYRYVLNVGEAKLAGLLTEATPVVEEGFVSVFPNPVSSLGTAKFSFNELTPAEISLYNTMGQKVRDLSSGTYTPGEHSVYFDVQNIPNGVYFVTLTTQKGRFNQKIVVSK
ncbi:MAG: Omp28-related outer membrane protein [Bacteroidia bacterium]|nr:Omp28-related outer membrane protein [Bacteroidia bacterium]